MFENSLQKLHFETYTTVIITTKPVFHNKIKLLRPLKKKTDTILKKGTSFFVFPVYKQNYISC